MENKVKAGDIVVAVENHHPLNKGEEYEVVKVEVFYAVKDKKGVILADYLASRFAPKEGQTNNLIHAKEKPMADEKFQTLVDLLQADASKIEKFSNNSYLYEGKQYWVAEDSDDRNGMAQHWRWVGQLGTTHVYRHK